MTSSKFFIIIHTFVVSYQNSQKFEMCYLSGYYVLQANANECNSPFIYHNAREERII